MTARVLRPAITFATVSAVLLAALAVYLLLAGASTTHADAHRYDATNTQTLTSTATGAARGQTTALNLAGNIGVSGQYNFSNNVTFDPPGVTLTPVCNEDSSNPGVGNNYDFRDFNNNNVVDGGETPCLAAGSASSPAAGQQNSQVALGLLNGRCNAPLNVIHDFFVIPTPNNEANPRASTNIVYPRPEGSNNRYHGWQVGSEPPGAGGTAPDDVDSNTRYEGTANTLMVHYYPDYLLDLFDPDGIAGPLNPVIPRQVFGGISSVAGTDVPLIFAIFQAGDINIGFATDMPHPFARMTAAAGHPSQAVLNDPTALSASPSTITDFCTPLQTTSTLNATVGGVTRATNPGTTGTHMGMNFTSSQRDSDNDSYENQIDTCPLAANTDNPRATAGADQDAGGTTVGDMLDPACDPSPTGIGSQNNDQDGDTFPNAQDNCPLVSNVTQQDAEVNVTSASGGMDGGPLVDGIGDTCDSGSITITINNKSTTLTFSSLVGNGPFLVSANPLPNCYGGTDGDGDGYCTTQDGADGGACATTTPQSCKVRHNAWTTTAADAPLLELDTDRAGGDTTTASDPGNAAAYSPAVTLTAAINASVTTGVAYTSTGDPIAVNDIIQIDAEKMLVTAVDTGGNTIDVTRGYLGTTAATHAINAPVYKFAAPIAPAVTLAAAAGATDRVLTLSSVAGISVGSLLLIDNEIVCVVAIDGIANTVTVLRGCAGTTAAAHAISTPVLKLAITVQRLTPVSTIACPGGASDVCPENGFDSDHLETYVGSNAAQACAQDTTLNNEPFDSWAYDFNDDQRANLSDVTAMGTSFNKFVNANIAYGTAITVNTAVAAADIQVTYTSAGDPVAVGDIINIDNESMKVVGVNTATNTLDVARSWWGTTAAAHSGGATINKAVGSRYDINGDGSIGLSDVTAFGPFFNKQCRRVDGTFGTPQ